MCDPDCCALCVVPLVFCGGGASCGSGERLGLLRERGGGDAAVVVAGRDAAPALPFSMPVAATPMYLKKVAIALDACVNTHTHIVTGLWPRAGIRALQGMPM